MDIKYKLYPYPVLAYYSDDYVGCSFNTVIEIVKEGYNLKISFLASLDNKELLSLIDSEQAAIAYHIECAQTGYRTAMMTKDMEFTKIIPDKNICGKLKICPFIVASKDISDYVNESFNEDYRGYKFQIDSGCVMAVGQQVNFDINKEQNELTNAKSIFVITKDADPTAMDMSIDIGRNKITIKLPEKDYFQYKRMHQTQFVQTTLNSMLIVPALIYVLSEINNSTTDERYENLSNYNWYKSIRTAMKKRFNKDIDSDSDSFDSSELILYAQQLIRSPLSEALEYLAMGYDDGEGDDE